MTTDPNKTDPCSSLLACVDPEESVRRHSPWGIVSAIPLVIWGAFALIGGAWGLLFLPGILVGGITIGTHTTLPKLLAWTLFHLVLTAHGYAMIVAAISFCRMRWRRGVRAIVVGVTVPVIVFTASYIVSVAFELAV